MSSDIRLIDARIALFGAAPQAPVGLRRMLAHVLANPLSRPDHLLILSDALRDASLAHRLDGERRQALVLEALAEMMAKAAANPTTLPP
jgi:hypothetical protein